jgi:hypothetical protein
MSPATAHPCRRELARRVSGGIEITLYWRVEDNSTSIEVWQPASEERLAFVVSGEHALDAFHHPFAHLPTTFGARSPLREAGVRR